MKENLKEGTVLQERYVLEKVIGRGGFGVTYRARDIRVDVPVAVKEYLSQWELSEKEALRETRLAAKFYDLEGTAAARDCFVENGHIFIVLEYVKGTSIKQHLKKKGRMDGKQTLEKMEPIIKSVGKIHRRGNLSARHQYRKRKPLLRQIQRKRKIRNCQHRVFP